MLRPRLPRALATIIPARRYVVVIDDRTGTRVIGPMSEHSARTYARHAPIRIDGAGLVTVHPLVGALEDLNDGACTSI